MISDAFDVLCGHHRFTEALFATWHGTARYSTASPAADADKLLLGEGHVLGLGLGTLRIDLDQINSSKCMGMNFASSNSTNPIPASFFLAIPSREISDPLHP